MRKLAVTTSITVLVFSLVATANAACPTLTGNFECPANVRNGKAKPYVVGVFTGARSGQYLFVYENGGVGKIDVNDAPTFNPTAGVWVRHRCEGQSLVSEYSLDQSFTSSASSRQEIDTDGNYRVIRFPASESFVCKRLDWPVFSHNR